MYSALRCSLGDCNVTVEVYAMVWPVFTAVELLKKTGENRSGIRTLSANCVSILRVSVRWRAVQVEVACH